MRWNRGCEAGSSGPFPDGEEKPLIFGTQQISGVQMLRGKGPGGVLSLATDNQQKYSVHRGFLHLKGSSPLC